MGRLRNLSASFKAAAFPNSNSNGSSPSLLKSSPNQHSSQAGKDNSTLVREQSANSFGDVPQSTPRHDRTSSRPVSMVYTPPSMEVGRESHIEELLPVFSYLSSHNNKLYQEGADRFTPKYLFSTANDIYPGYFLKLTDLDIHGKPYHDRNWTECFAQLVGTVLSLWDAAALDAAGQDGEVAPTFVNLADASIKMIETLPTRNPDVQPLQNVLSISTAGKNRYLLHFNSLHSLTQWTAGIRLAMFEHASLQELYTGSLIAGKGKNLNNIRVIMERSRFKTEDWARVRFGAGTPWRRCWCVIEPPDEKVWQKQNKSLKKKSAYHRPQLPKGEIKFYDTKKTKKAIPIATITDAYSAYAIYPQAKPLIDQSTLVKVEGRITIHSKPESKTEGFVFVMPELHPAVSGFEMLLRWLFPVYDVFHLYGRPHRLIADTWDTKGLMFAMPKERRYGYLDIMDVATLIHTQGSEKWNEREWRKHMKELTSKRMQMTAQNRSNTGMESQRGSRVVSEARAGVRYDDTASIRSSPSTGHKHNQSTDGVFTIQRKAVPTPQSAAVLTVRQGQNHTRSVSESVTYDAPVVTRRQRDPYQPSRLSAEYSEADSMPNSPTPAGYAAQTHGGSRLSEVGHPDGHDSSDSDSLGARTNPEDIRQEVIGSTPPAPVVPPPTFQHQAGELPQRRPDARPDLRREKSRMSNATLDQMAEVSKLANVANVANGGNTAGHAAMVAWQSQGSFGDQSGARVTTPHDNLREMSANQPPSEAMIADGTLTQSPTDTRPEFVHISSDHSITQAPGFRMPGPTKPTTFPTPDLPVSGRATSPNPMSPETNLDYDRASTGSPDYDSHPEDANPPSPPPKARTGVLKTVGDANLGTTTTGKPILAMKTWDIPDVDFGTTITPSLTPGHSRPGTAGGRKSPFDTLRGDPITPPSRSSPLERLTPNDDRRHSFMDRSSPRPGHSRSPSYAWQPGTIAGRQSPGGTLSAEDFVQQRAAVARTPSGYIPQRSTSASKIELSPTAMPTRSPSSRPGSRQSLLSMDLSAHLSAREQEHLAKMTGGPLISMPEGKKTPDPSVGLIGAIEAREQERKNIKEGVAGQMLQEAIAQRQLAERTYGVPQPAGYGQYPGGRQRGQWVNPYASTQWGVVPQIVTQAQPGWPATQGYQYQQSAYSPHSPHSPQVPQVPQPHQQSYGGRNALPRNQWP